MKAIVHPCETLQGRVDPPSSKNYTSRYLLASALAQGESTILHPAESDDATAMLNCLREWGARIESTKSGYRISGFGKAPLSGKTLNPDNAGAVVRFLMGVAALTDETRFVTDHHESLGTRPHIDLMNALEQLGCETESTGDDGRLPITIRGGVGRVRGGAITVSGEVSSQYLSALLFVAPLLDEEVVITVTGDLKSKPAVLTTLEVLREFEITVKHRADLTHFTIEGGQSYQSGTHVLNGDWPGSAALLAAATVTKGRVQVPNLMHDQQGERHCFEVLRDMGGQLDWNEGVVTILGGCPLHGLEFDGDLATDAVLALAAAAALAEGTTRFFNVENLRYKECDRITDFRHALGQLGVKTEERRDELIIHGNPEGYPGGVEVSGCGDHRVIMALSIVALRCRKPVTILGAEHVAKSYPAWFDDLRSLGAQIVEK